MGLLDYTQINISIEVCCLIVTLVLLIYTFANRKHAKSNRWFISLGVANITMLLGDAFCWFMYGRPGEGPHNVIWIGSMVYYVSVAFLIYFEMGYINSLMNNESTAAKILKSVALIFSIYEIVLSFVNMLTRNIFFVTSDNFYQRGELFILSQLPLLVAIMSIISVLIFRKRFSVNTFKNLIIVLILPAVGEFLQVFLPNLTGLVPCITLALIWVFAFVQTEERVKVNEMEKELVVLKNTQLEQAQKYGEHLLEQIVSVLGNSVEAKDVYTKGHSLRVAEYTREITRRMGWSEQEQLRAYYVGILHDIGKIRIPDTIINKPGTLSDEEFDLIKIHPVAGYHILKNITELPELAEGARWHHERYDGKGYPNGIFADDIPLLSRIIAVADAYDAMTSARSYRSAMPQEKVRAEMIRCSGTQFDPEIAAIMVNMIDDDVNYDMCQKASDDTTEILLIDEDSAIVNEVIEGLGGEFNITSAQSGEAGIEALKNNDYDLCLLDVNLPDIRGFDVLDWINSNKKTKVILLTEDRNYDTIKKGNECGAFDYLSKPVHIQSLKESIRNVVSR